MARNPKLDALKSAIRKEHGNVSISMANAVRDMPRLSTQSLAMDRALGGGIPGGRVTIIYGGEGSGKTSTALRVIGGAQNLCANCYRPVPDLEFEEEIDDEGEVVISAVGYCDCYKQGLMKTVQFPEEKVSDYKDRLKMLEKNSYEEFRAALLDVEKVFSIDWATRFGVDPRRLLYMVPYTAEQAMDMYDELLRTGAVHLLVVDSVAAMEPKEELEKSTYEATQALVARKMGIMTRKTASAMAFVSQYYRKLPAQIWINQEREKLDIAWGDNKVMPGGNAQKFASGITMRMWTSKLKKEVLDSDLKKDFQSEIGTQIQVNFKTEKNTTAPAYQRGSFVMWTSGEDMGRIDELPYFLAMAEKFGLFRTVEEKKKKTWFVGDEQYDKKKDAIDRIQEPDTYAEMRRIILNKMLGVK